MSTSGDSPVTAGLDRVDRLALRLDLPPVAEPDEAARKSVSLAPFVHNAASFEPRVDTRPTSPPNDTY
jgi:hypothetical protein